MIFHNILGPRYSAAADRQTRNGRRPTGAADDMTGAGRPVRRERLLSKEASGRPERACHPGSNDAAIKRSNGHGHQSQVRE